MTTNVERGMNVGHGTNVERGMNVGHGTNVERGVNVGHGTNVERGASANRPSGVYNNPGATTHPFSGSAEAARGYAEPRGESGVHSGAFSNYDHGGEARSFSSRGSASVGGGHGGGGGGGAAHGGGGRPR